MVKKLTLKQFIEEAVLAHGDKYDYSNVIYLGLYVKVIIICSIHGEFLQRPCDHLRGNGCSKCHFDKLSIDRRSNKDEWVRKAFKVHGNKNDYSRFVYEKSWVKGCITCLTGGHGDYWQTPNNHLRGEGCPKCHLETIGKWNTSNIEEWTEKAFKVHGAKFDYSFAIYIKDNIKIRIKCNVCEYIFEQTPNAHLQGQGCPRCKKSKGELAIIDILDKNDIDFKDEYKLPEVEGNYRYDFYLPDYRILIEFHGIQHYEYIEHFHKDEDRFLANKNTDDIKKDNAYRFKYRLLEFNHKQLKYMTKEDFEQMVVDNIKKQG